MLWLLLWIIWTFFEELNNSITKDKTKKYHYITVWVVTSLFSIILYLVIAAYKFYSWNFELSFAVASIPLLCLRAFLEILQSYYTLLAIKYCDRSTFSIIRILTIPWLVLADILLWYDFSFYSLLWIWIIVLSFIWFNTNTKSINWKWWYYVLFTAINAVFTISLFKYSISHYGNSVEIDQFLMILSIFIFFILYNYKKEKKLGFYLLKKEKMFWVQWIFIAIASLVLSYSYLYLNASEATAVKRAWEMFWAVIAGCLFFQENHFWKKICFALCLIIWLIVMIL